MRGEGLLEVNDFDPLPTCESYLLGKMTKSPFTRKVNKPQTFWVWYILMYADPWRSVLEEDTGISLRSQTTFRGMVMSFWWDINLSRLKCSNIIVVMWKNKSKRVLKYFNLIEAINTSSMSLWCTLRRMRFSLSGLLLEHLSCTVCPKGGIEPC